MSSEQRKQKLAELIAEYNKFKLQGKLDLTSEETIRTWMNELLAIFDWDVRDTSQILQEKILSKTEKDKLKDIGSQNTRPDYTFRIAKQKLTFLDAKDISVRILVDAEAAFQIKSYGWSILAPCAFISNFEEFAIYDCTYIPEQKQDPTLGRLYLRIDDYVANYYNAELKSKLARVAKRVEELQNRYKTSSPTQKRAIGRLLLTQWNSLDELCYQFYDLTDTEKAFFNDRGRNVDRIQILD